MKKVRDVTVDIVRALAIALMVSANMAVIAYGEPSWIFRLSSSLAAPLFVAVAMMMIVLNNRYGSYFLSALYKATFLVVVAALLDISNSLMPIAHIDILYLMAILLILISFVWRLPNPVLIGIIIAVLAVTPYLQHVMGYQASMPFALPHDLNEGLAIIKHDLPHRYLIDGWFPFFPWVSIALFGVIIGKARYKKNTIRSFANSKYVLISLLLIAAGAAIWWFMPGQQMIRYDYIELFYQPTPGFMITVMGFMMGIIALVDSIGDVGIWKVIHPLGEAPLFMYVFHITIIDHVMLPFGKIPFGWIYFGYYLVLISVMILLGLGLRKVRAQRFYKKMPHFVRWMFG